MPSQGKSLFKMQQIEPLRQSVQKQSDKWDQPTRARRECKRIHDRHCEQSSNTTSGWTIPLSELWTRILTWSLRLTPELKHMCSQPVVDDMGWRKREGISSVHGY